MGSEHQYESKTPEVILLAPPLVRVLTQVRFPQFAQFKADEDRTARQFAAVLAEDFPLYEEGHDTVLTFGPEGPVQSASPSRIWRFRSIDGAWQVSLGAGFLSLDTGAYQRRSHFASRFRSVWERFLSVVQPPYVERLGIRYINRITEASLITRLPELLTPQILGVAGSEVDGTLTRAVTEATYSYEAGGALVARWGILSPGETLDPMLTPADSRSWVMDLDSSAVWSPGMSQGADLVALVPDLALRCFRFFTQAVTDEFRNAHGGVAE